MGKGEGGGGGREGGGRASQFRIRAAFLYKITLDTSYLGKQVHVTTQHLTSRCTRAVYYHVARRERESERERERERESSAH